MPGCFAGAGPEFLASCRIQPLQAYVLQTERVPTSKLSCACVYMENFSFFLVIFNFSGVFLISNSETSLDREL